MKPKNEIVDVGITEITVDVSLLTKTEEMFFNATQMAKPFGKRPDDFWKQSQNKEYLDALITLSEDIERIHMIQEQDNTAAPVCKVKYKFSQEEVFKLFVRDNEVVEVRILNAWGKSSAWDNDFAKGTVSGYFDNYDSFKRAVSKAIEQQQNNIYFTLQVIDPRLIGRAYNKLKPTDLTTSDNNVRYYRWIPIDIDPDRPSGVSSSDSELSRAIEIRDTIREWIIDTTEYKAPITAISGNGAHILIRLPKDIPVNDDSKEFVRGFLENVHSIFSTDKVTIDTTVFNPARIWKLYGSKAMKGDEVPGNQYREALVHRESFIDDLGGVNV